MKTRKGRIGFGTYLLVALTQLSCSSSSSGGMADTSVHPGCMVPGTYVPTAKRSTTNPGTCPASTELLLQREDIVIPAGAMECQAADSDGTSTGSCNFTYTSTSTPYTTEVHTIEHISLQSCAGTTGSNCTLNYDVVYKKKPPTAADAG